VWTCDDLRIKGLDVHRSDTCSWLAASSSSILESLAASSEVTVSHDLQESLPIHLHYIPTRNMPLLPRSKSGKSTNVGSYLHCLQRDDSLVVKVIQQCRSGFRHSLQLLSEHD